MSIRDMLIGCFFSQWRIQKVWKGGRKTIYQPSVLVVDRESWRPAEGRRPSRPVPVHGRTGKPWRQAWRICAAAHETSAGGGVAEWYTEVYSQKMQTTIYRHFTRKRRLFGEKNWPHLNPPLSARLWWWFRLKNFSRPTAGFWEGMEVDDL